MKFYGNINYQKCIEYGLNLSQGAIMDLLLNLSSWAEGKEINGSIYYYLSSGKLLEELPIISNKKNTFLVILKVLKCKGLIDSILLSNKSYYKLTDNGKSFLSVEKNQDKCGKKSRPSVEKNQDNNNTSNNYTNNKLLISKDINSDAEEENLNNNSFFINGKEAELINLHSSGGGEKFGNNEINELIDIIKSYNSGIVDGTVQEQRRYGNNLLKRLKQIDKIQSGSYIRQDYIKAIFEIISKNSYHSHKITGPKKIFYELAGLIAICNQEYQKQKKKETINIEIL